MSNRAPATILSVSSIDAPVDEHGTPVMPGITFHRSTIKSVHTYNEREPELVSFIFSHPASFDCTLKVRSSAARASIQQELDWSAVGI